MPVLKINDFGGRQPSRSARLIPGNYGQVAANLDLGSGQLAAFRGLYASLTGISWFTPLTAFKLGGAWLTWSTYVNVVKADVSASDNRILFTGSGYPKLTNYTMAMSGAQSTRPTQTRRLGVTVPTTTPVIEVLGVGEDPTVDSVSYCFTFVTEFGEESAPFTPTTVRNIKTGNYIKLTNFSVPDLASCGNDIKYIRLYRLSAGTSGAEFQRVKARPVNLSATPTYNIDASAITGITVAIYDADDDASPTGLNQDLGDDLQTEGWDPPPDNLEGLVRFSNGMYAGFVDNKIYLNVPGYYYAFPAGAGKNYTVETAHDVVALGVFNDMLVAGTEGYPEVISGTDARAMQRSPLPYQQPCLSKRGMVSFPAGVMYPCPDGMFMISSAGGEVITDAGPGRAQLISRNDWNNYSLTKMIANYYNQKVYIFFEDEKTGLVYDFIHHYIIDISINVTVKDVFVTPTEDRLYIMGLMDGQSDYGIYVWGGDGASLLAAEWKSKIIETSPTNWSAARVEGDYSTGAATFKLYADGVLKHTQTVSNDESFRLPAGFRARDWEILIDLTNAKVSSIYLANSMGELHQV